MGAAKLGKTVETSQTTSGVLRAYLDELLSAYYYLDFRGIAQLERIVSLELDEVFVPLKATPLAIEEQEILRLWAKGFELGTAGSDSSRFFASDRLVKWQPANLDQIEWKDWSNLSLTPAWRTAVDQTAFEWASGAQGNDWLKASPDRHPSDQWSSYVFAALEKFRGKGGHESGSWSSLQEALALKGAGAASGSPQDFRSVLSSSRQFVLVGDPGAGKTTLIKWMARSCALGAGAMRERLGLEENLVPIVIPVARYARECRQGKGDPKPVGAYIEEYYDTRAKGLGRELRKEMEAGRAFLFFDGLDEVPDLQVRLTVSRVIEACLRACMEKGPGSSRCMVTSRKFGYELCRILDVPHWELAGFEAEQIERFSRGWFKALERSLRPQAPNMEVARKEAADLVEAITGSGSVHHDSLQSFAQNPLLLTIVALVRWQYGILPERRARLYEMALTTLIETWNRMRGLAGPAEGIQLNANQTMHLWEPVALRMHLEYPGGTAPRSMILRYLAETLMRDGVSQEAALQTAQSYLDTAARWAGLLIERGPGVFGFVHQTFQEYLAARKLVGEASSPYEELAPHLFDPRWHEVVLLAAGYLGEVQNRPQASTELVETIRDTSDVLEPILHRRLILAAEILADRAPVTARCYEDTVRRLLELLPESQHVPTLADNLANALAALSEQELRPDVLKRAEACYSSKGLDWPSRAAVLLLAKKTPKKALGLLQRALEDSAPNVSALAASILLPAKSVDQEKLLRLLQPRWPETSLKSLNRAAQRCMSEAVRDAAVQAGLVGLLHYKEPQVRFRAAEVLQTMRPLSEAEQAGLAGLLRDKEPGVRFRAAEVLQTMRPLSEAEQAGLVGLLQDKEPGVRVRAAAVLQTVHPLSEADQAGLVGLLQDKKPGVRVRAAAVLQTVRPLSEAEQAGLVGLLQDKEPEVRVRAAEVLQTVQPLSEAAQAGLVGLLQDKEPWVRLRAAEVLQTVRSLSEAAQAGLVGLLQDKEPGVRVRAVAVLQTARPLSEAAQAELVRLLADKESNVRAGALEVVLTVRPLTAAAEAGLVGLLQDKAPWLRVRAAEGLQSVRPLSEAEQAGLVGLLQNKEPWLRVRAAEGLQSVRPLSEAEQAGLVGLLQNKEPRMRLRAAEVLQTVRPLSEAEQAGLVGLLQDKAPEVRFRAARTLAEIVATMATSPSWLKTEPRQATKPPSEPSIKEVEAPDFSVRKLLELVLLGKESQREQALRALEGALSPGSDLFAGRVKEATEALTNERLRRTLHSADKGLAAARAVLAGAFGRRLRDLIARRAAGGGAAAKLELDFVKGIPGTLLPEAVAEAVEELTDESRAAALERMVEAEFDGSPPEMRRKLLGFYSRLRGVARPAQMEQMLRRSYRARDDDEPETRAQAGRTLAAFLPDLEGKARRRCFDALVESASDSDKRVSRAVREAFELIYGHLTKPERAALRREGIRIS